MKQKISFKNQITQIVMETNQIMRHPRWHTSRFYVRMEKNNIFECIYMPNIIQIPVS